VPAFAYRAVDLAGKRQRGRAEAASAAALTRLLEDRGLVVLGVDGVESEGRPSGGLRLGRRRMVLEFTRALAALLPAGMPLARALATATNTVSGEVADVVTAVRAQVERGESIAAALAQHPALFPPVYIGLVRAGERSGDLSGAFQRLADQLEREDQLRGRLLSASIYPMLLVLVGGVAVVVLLLFVLPRFVELLDDAGASLPRSTGLLLAFSAAMQRWWPVLLAGAVVAGVGATAASVTARGRRIGSALLLHLPIVGGLRRTSLAARFARSVGVLVGGGAPLLSALDDGIESLADPLARDEVARIRSRVREGASLNVALGESALFPPLLGQLVAVGEESGRLRDFLLKAADLFEDRAARMMQRLVTLVEPAMIVGFGTIVAFVAISLLQAIYGVNAGAFR
jgi:general secretion pathway protein F